MLYENKTKIIIKAFYKVYNTLGYGFMEKVYENAMVIELTKSNFKIEQQKIIKVFYEEKIVGDYYADLLIDDEIILELKACETINDAHKAQLLNYLKATDKNLGLLLNFGKQPEVKRIILNEKL